MVIIKGFVHQDFKKVKQVFERNFEEGLELGASCALYHKGELVVDLWGGYRDKKKTLEWEKDTIACVFSTTKGFASMCMAVAISRGLLDLEKPVAEYWKEFSQSGKEDITVRQLLNHLAGLSAIDEYLTPEKISDLEFMSEVLARQKPAWKPGTRHGYHGTSLGFFQNELLRRIDPKHRTISKFLKEEIADTLKADLHIGLSINFDENRIAEMVPFHMYELLLNMRKVSTKMILSLMNPWSLVFRSLARIKMKGPGDIASKKYRHLEMASANGYSNARSVARAFSEFATGGQKLEISESVYKELMEMPEPPINGIRDLILYLDMKYSMGFFKPSPDFNPMLSDSSFSSMGAGGSLAIADPKNELGFGYVMNKMSIHMGNDPRTVKLLAACYDCIN